jgi:hypothetical protein
MATVTPKRAPEVAQHHARIASPLERLRGYIRGYVTLEGLGLGLLFLCVWFWVGMLFDWGLFKALGVDIVQQWPWAFRAIVLVGLSSFLVTILLFTIVFRFLVQFSDRAMAKVLEHRFPHLLQDKLITAVELHDPAEAAKYGYSPDMIRQTIADAAVQVEKVPVKEAFNWKRLRNRAVWVGILSVGAYLFVGASVTGISAVVHKPEKRVGYADLNETAALWVERNILLQNTIWPRRAHLQLVDYQEGLRIPKKSTPPSLRVRAWKYVVAAPKQPEGWRQLTWAELKENAWMAGDVPELPADWNGTDQTTVDEVELKLAGFGPRQKESINVETSVDANWCIATVDEAFDGWRPLLWSDLTADKLGGLEVPSLPAAWELNGPAISVDEVQAKLSADAAAPGAEAIRVVFARLIRLDEIQKALTALDTRATDRAHKRKLRKLTVPSEVNLRFWSVSRTNNVPCVPVGGNEFIANFGELDEDVTFIVRGEDYYTAPRVITVVERPQLEKLESQEERPAYLYYRPGADGTPLVADIAGKRQPFAPLQVSTSGEVTTLEPVIGTTLTLIGTTTKKLTAVVIDAEEKDRKQLVAGEVAFEQGGTEFRCTFPNVRREQKFTFRFTDHDNVTAERKVVITPRADVPPTVRDFNPDDVLRRDKVGYLVTANARLPFKARVTDDYGLGNVSYGCRVFPSDFLSDQKIRALDGIAAIGLATTPVGALGQALPWLVRVQKNMLDAAGDDALEEQLIPLTGFLRQARNNRHSDASPEFLTLETMKSRLANPQRDPYRQLFKTFVLTADDWTEQDEDGGSNPARWVNPADSDKAPLFSDLGLWQLTYKDNDQRRPLKETDITKPQKRFNVEIRLIAEDTYLEGEVDPQTKKPIPHITASSETFTFVVVPENELLAKIGEEEEQKYRDLQKAFKPLPDNLDRLRDISFELASAKVDEGLLVSFQARCESLSEVLQTSHQDVRAVTQAYERIVREMRLNQVRDDMQSKVFKSIFQPLQTISERQFDITIRAVNTLQSRLATKDTPPAERERAAAEAKKELNDLVNALNGVLAAMEGINTINKLIEELARIEKKEEDLERIITQRRKKLIEELLGDD